MSDYGRVMHGGRPQWVVVTAGEAVLLGGPPWEQADAARGAVAVDGVAVEWLAPVAPSKIVAVGRNYASHARERGASVPTQPLLFLKAPSAVLRGGGDVVLPRESRRVDHEAELAIVIGRRTRRFKEGDPLDDVLLGFLAADDVTARDVQEADGQWARGKSFDTFCPVAGVIRSVAPAPDARIEARVNGDLRQAAALSDMVFGLSRIVAHASAAMTLEPGDLILTGTPEGVGPLAEGDSVRVSVEGLPDLVHGVRREADE